MRIKNIVRVLFLIISIMIYSANLCFAEESGSSSQSFSPHQQAPSGPNPGGLVSSDNFLFTGSMVSQYPLEVPAGTAGMQPELALVYNSSSGNGWCGVGWDLSMGLIQRSTKNGIPKYDGTDTFIFNFKGSSQELVLVEKKTYSSIYRAKIESGFMKFIHNRTSDMWIVLDKNGTEYFFGNSNNSQIDQPYTEQTPYGLTFSWLLDTVTDVHGNSMQIDYDNHKSQPYPKQIRYTYNRRQGLNFSREIKFNIENRPDIRTNYRAGFPITIAKRLESIVMKVKIGYQWKLVRKYKLLYDTSADTSRSVLSSVTLFGDDGEKTLPFTAFGYLQGETGITGFNTPQVWNSSWVDTTGEDMDRLMTGDFNADGLSDMLHVEGGSPFSWHVYLSEGNGFKKENNVWHTEAIDPTGDDYDWLMQGDFNGDSKTDLLRVSGDDASWKVLLSTGDGFTDAGTWHTAWVDPSGKDLDRLMIGDYNADGLSDVLHVEGGYPFSWHVYLSEGNGFKKENNVWHSELAEPTGEDYDWLMQGDFNGDSKTDLLRVSGNDASWKVLLSTGDGFTDAGTWHTAWVDPSGKDLDRLMIGDYNADGLSDVLHVEGGYPFSWHVYLSEGNGFKKENNVWFTEGAGRYYDWIMQGDFNGDSKTDIIYIKPETNGWKILLSTGKGFNNTGVWRTGRVEPEGDKKDFLWVLDADGNKMSDILHVSGDNADWNVITKAGNFPDMLTHITNPLGGTTDITYKPSTQYKNQCLPFPMYVVDKITTDNSIDDAVTITYDYEGGLFDKDAREFLGFSRVSKYDAENHRADTYFYQTHAYGNALKGKIKKQEVFEYNAQNSSYEKLQYSESTYNVDTFEYTPDSKILYTRYVPSVSSVDTYVTSQNGEKHTAIEYEYNNYGNPVKISNLGEVSDASDNIYTYIEYASNDELDIGDIFRRSLPTRQYTTPVEGDESQKIQEAKLYYDGDTDHTQAPGKGNLTKQESWLKETSSYLEVKRAYDAFGNVTFVTDAKGNTTETKYENTTHTFPSEITNELGHTKILRFNKKFGVIEKEIDTNGQAAQYTYDTFGRLKKIIGPKDSSQYPAEEYIYPDLTEQAPHKIQVIQRIERETDNTLDTYTFIDGLGRTLQNQSPAAESSQWVISGETSINARGLVEKAYIPYYMTTSQPNLAFGKYSEPQYQDEKPHTAYSYDAVGRVILTAYPDDTYTRSVYDGWTETKHDPNGNRTDYVKDAYGRIIEVKEYNNNGTDIYSTIYSYDTAGNLVKIINDIGEETSIVYDSLGRKTSMDDPKMGHWEYQYDSNGNLIWQKDAKAQITTLEYDKLNRITKKEYYEDQIAFDNSLPDDEQTITYGYDTDSENNICIGRLVKVTDATGETKFIYDELGQIIETTKVIKGNIYITKSTYDALGRQTSLVYPDGEIIKYEYDAGGQLKTVASNTATYASNITYNASGQMNELSYGNGIITSNYTYDIDTFRLTHLKTHNGITDLQNFSYEYDNIGNITSIIDNVNTATVQTFEYDDINRLTKAFMSYGPEGAVDYEYMLEYDSVGNILEKDGQDLTDYSEDWECDFEDEARGWRPIQGEWEVKNGKYYINESEREDIPGNTPYARSVTTRKWLNPEFSIDMNTSYPASGDWNVAYILFDYQDENNFYYFLIHSGKGILELSKFQDGKQYFYLGGWKTSMHNPYEHYNEQKREPNKITIRQYYNRIQIYVNDSLEMDYWDENPLIGGKIGVQAKLSRCYFDNLNVKVDATSDLGKNVAIPVDTFEPLTGSWFVHDKKYRGSVGRSVYEVIYSSDDLNDKGIQIDYTVQTLTPGRYNWETGWLNFNYEDEDNFYYFVIHKTNKDTREIELSKFQDGERYELYKSSDTPSGLYNPLEAQNISIKLNENDTNPTALDILIHVEEARKSLM